MLRRIAFLLLILGLILTSNTPIFAGEKMGINTRCDKGDTCKDNPPNPKNLACKPAFKNNGDPDFDVNLNTRIYTCQEVKGIEKVFGVIDPPQIIAQFLQKDATGASAISQFLSNFIALLFGIAAVVLIFMIIWGAFDWTTSGGDKEKLASAQKRIINAIIGIILFSVAFALLTILGRFTGFTLFRGQNYIVTRRDSNGNITGFACRQNKNEKFGGIYTDEEADEWCRR